MRYRHDELKKQIDKIKVSMTPHPEISDFDRAWVSPLWERLLSDEENLDDPERYYKIAVIINNVREQTAVYRVCHLSFQTTRVLLVLMYTLTSHAAQSSRTDVLRRFQRALQRLEGF